MPTITDLTYTNNMAPAKKPLLTDLEAALQSFEDHLNDKVADNLVQTALDAFGAAYAFDDDGAANFATMTLYNKLTAKDTYTGGNIAIAAVGAWTDVDATNAAVSITPELLTGDFDFTFQFSVQVVTTNAVNAADIRFRLTDGTTTSDAIPNIKLITATNAQTYVIPITLAHQFSSMTVGLKTVKLQYYIATTTATTITVLANTNTPIAMQAEKI